MGLLLSWLLLPILGCQGTSAASGDALLDGGIDGGDGGTDDDAGQIEAGERTDAQDVKDGSSAARDAAPGDANAGDASVADASPGGTSCHPGRPAWLLCEDFEGMEAGCEGWLEASPWTENIGADDRGRMTSSREAHSGQFALLYPALASADYQGADLIWRACAGANRPGCTPLLGYPRLYFRAWIRFAPDHERVHHFLSLGGGPINDYWAPYGNAGCRPNGESSMGTTVDFSSGTHESFFYTYFPEMRCDPGNVCARYSDPDRICRECAAKGMPCNDGPECCWGNLFEPDPPVALPVGRWFCLELMLRANDVGSANGEMAYWVDGRLAKGVSGMRFRDVEELQLNQARLQHYITTDDAEGHSNQVWFDDVVISREPIGCE